MHVSGRCGTRNNHYQEYNNYHESFQAFRYGTPLELGMHPVWILTQTLWARGTLPAIL